MPHVRRVMKEGFRHMPNLQLDEEQIESLIEYLRYVGASGRFPPRSWPSGGLEN
jgi:hypothetical protein